MASEETKRYMELQMSELKESFGSEEAAQKAKSKDYKNPKHAEMAAIYEDLAEYESELEDFEKEFAIVNAHKLEEIATVLTQELPDEERNYAQELQGVLIAIWTHYVETEQTHPQEQLDLIKQTPYPDVIVKLKTTFPDYHGNFEDEIREAFLKRWETLIAIKKEHIKEEVADIKTMGLKPNYVKRVYKLYHGIE
jgi:hypothetical protein